MPRPPDYPPAFVDVPQISTIFVTIASVPPSATPTATDPRPGSPSNVKAIIAGTVIGSVLGCCLVLVLVFWLCWQRPNRSAYPGDLVLARPGNDKRIPESLFGRSCLGSRSKQPIARQRESRLRKAVPVPSRPAIGRHSFATSTDGEVTPRNIPMVHPRFPYSKPPTTSSGLNRVSSMWRRGSADEARDIKPPPYQYGVVGSRRVSVSTQPPSPGSPLYAAYGMGLGIDPADQSFGGPTGEVTQYFNQDTPSLPTSQNTSYSSSMVQPKNQVKVSMQQIPSEFGYGSKSSGSAYSVSGSRHSNTPPFIPSIESKDRHISMPGLLSRPGISHPHPSSHRSYPGYGDRQSRSDEGHSPPTSLHASTTSSYGALQRSQSMENRAGSRPISYNHHVRRAYDHRPRSGGAIMPPPSAFSFSSLGPTVTASSDSSVDKDSPQGHRNEKAVELVPASRPSSTPPMMRTESRRLTRESRPPSPPDSLLDELAVLARNARHAERLLRSRDDWERDRSDNEEGPKVLVLRNG